MGQRIYAVLALILFATISFAGTARRVGTGEQITKYGGAGGTDCGGGGCDYTALGTWEAAFDTDHVTDTETDVLECFDDAASFDDNTLLAGSTNDATFFRIVRSASGEGHDGTSNNGVFFDLSSNSQIFDIQESFTQIQDLICQISSNSGGSSSTLRTDNTGTDQKFIGCIVFDSNNSGAGVADGIDLRRDNSFAILCLVENSESHNYRIRPLAGNTAFCYNCISVDSADDGFNHINGTGTLKNCLSTGSTSEDFDAGTYTGSVNCSSEDATTDNLPAGSHRKNQTFTFVNAAGNDYHLNAADAGADNFGTDLSGDGTFAFDDDINDGTMGAGKSGELFNTWDIGFDENDVAAVGRRIFLIGMLYNFR